jgi:hypothetical protein
MSYDGRMHTAPPPSSSPLTAPAASLITVDAATLEGILDHAASAAQLVGHLDDKAQPELIRQIGEHVDTIAHELTELLGKPDAVAHDSAPMLTSIAGGAP